MAVDDDLRHRMGTAAVAAARAVGYTNAGTVEFLLDETGAFYFLEVNTRLQVEHPVTEMITGLDLVEAQVRVAAGERLPFDQDTLERRGHAIECRVCAEDPGRGFLPSTGRIEHYRPPAAPNIRVDSGVTRGSEVSVYYDPLLAKLIVWGETREAALRRMDWALSRFVLTGVTTNVEYLRRVLRHPEFVAGRLDTRFLERHVTDTTPEQDEMPDAAWIAAALAVRDGSISGGGNGSGRISSGRAARDPHSGGGNGGPWQATGAWRAY